MGRSLYLGYTHGTHSPDTKLMDDQLSCPVDLVIVFSVYSYQAWSAISSHLTLWGSLVLTWHVIARVTLVKACKLGDFYLVQYTKNSICRVMIDEFSFSSRILANDDTAYQIHDTNGATFRNVRAAHGFSFDYIIRGRWVQIRTETDEHEVVLELCC